MAGGIHPPVSVVETWPTPNYTDPINRGWGMTILCSVLGTVSFLVVLLRFYARFVLQKNPGLDDWLVVAAMLPVLGLVVGVCLAEQVFDFNRHIWDVPMPQFVNQRKITFANEILYVLASGFIKISILFFYRRLTNNSLSRTFIHLVWASIAFVIAYMITFIFTVSFHCSPISAFWYELSPAWVAAHSYHCNNEGANLLAASVISVLQDFVAALLPIVLFWRLQIPIRQKIVLAAIFAVGFFLCITGILRIYYIHQIFYTTYDVTWNSFDLWAWTVVEVLVGLICASAPALKVYFNHYLGGTITNFTNTFSRRTSGPAAIGSAERRSASFGTIPGSFEERNDSFVRRKSSVGSSFNPDRWSFFRASVSAQPDGRGLGGRNDLLHATMPPIQRNSRHHISWPKSFLLSKSKGSGGDVNPSGANAKSDEKAAQRERRIADLESGYESGLRELQVTTSVEVVATRASDEASGPGHSDREHGGGRRGNQWAGKEWNEVQLERALGLH